MLAFNVPELAQLPFNVCVNAPALLMALAPVVQFPFTVTAPLKVTPPVLLLTRLFKTVLEDGISLPVLTAVEPV